MASTMVRYILLIKLINNGETLADETSVNIRGDVLKCSWIFCPAGAPGVGRRELKKRLIDSDPDYFKEPVPCKL